MGEQMGNIWGGGYVLVQTGRISDTATQAGGVGRAGWDMVDGPLYEDSGWRVNFLQMVVGGKVLITGRMRSE